MKVLHLFAAGGFGGIESLCRDYAVRTRTEAVFVFAWEPGAFAQTLRAQGCRVVALGASRRNPAGTLHRLAALCRAEHPQALVLHHDAPVLHACALCLRRMFPRLCVVAYAHSNAADLRGGRGSRALALRRALLRASFRTADGVIAVSHSVRGSLVRQFRVPEQRVAVVYNGVDTGRFSPSPRGAAVRRS